MAYLTLDLIPVCGGRRHGMRSSHKVTRSASLPFLSLTPTAVAAGAPTGYLGHRAHPSRFRNSLASALDRSVTACMQINANEQMCQHCEIQEICTVGTAAHEKCKSFLQVPSGNQQEHKEGLGMLTPRDAGVMLVDIHQPLHVVWLAPIFARCGPNAC